jgi:ABC-type transport system involved in cytochrome bd biosynthesis fused ATPase/permease subunit
MTLTWRQDGNGNWAGYFQDRLKRWCVLRQSTRTEPVICLGLDDSSWMHLTREQVQELLPHLARFVETGSLREKGQHNAGDEDSSMVRE